MREPRPNVSTWNVPTQVALLKLGSHASTWKVSAEMYGLEGPRLTHRTGSEGGGEENRTSDRCSGRPILNRVVSATHPTLH